MVRNGDRGDKVTGKRVEILKSAATAFRRRGYHGASVDEIASALKMTKGNLYYYFKNKEEILYFCHDYSLDIILDLLHTTRRENLAPDEQLRKLIVGFVHLIIDELHGTALTIDLQALSPALLKKIVAKRDRFDRGLRDIVLDGIRQGVFAETDPKLVGFAIVGAVNWIPKWFDPEGRASSTEIGEVFAAYLLAGLKRGAAPAGQPARSSARLTQ